MSVCLCSLCVIACLCACVRLHACAFVYLPVCLLACVSVSVFVRFVCLVVLFSCLDA